MLFCYGIAKGGKMLEYLRNAAEKTWAKVLMFVLIFSFVGWGAAEWIFTGSSRDTTLVRVGGSEISVQQYNNERSRQFAGMSKDEQRATYADPAKSEALIKKVIGSLTMNQLAMNRAKDMGYAVSDKRIADEIRSYPQFQNNGKFEPWMFDMVLQNSGMTERDFANALRADILRQMALGAFSTPVDVPKFAVDAFYNARYAKRDIKYSTIKFADFKVGDPTDEQLKTYYAQHPKIIPEKRAVSYVFLAADMNKPDEYDEGFKKAQQVEDMIISGASMKEAADKFKIKFVTVPAFARNEKISDKILSDGLVDKVFAMNSGMESELMELKEGFVILRVDDIKAEHNANFESVRKDLISGWKKSEQRKNAYVRANEDLVVLNKGGTLKDAKSATVSRTEGAPIVVLNSAFAERAGANVISEDDDAFYVVHVDKNIAPKSDDKKKDAIRTELKNLSAHYVSDDYGQFLKRKYPVKINQRVYDRFITK